MKTMIETKGMNRVSIAMVFLTMVMATGYGQGLLLEGAAKLYNSLRNTENVPEYVAVHTNYLPVIETKGNSFRLNAPASIFNKAHKEELQEATTYNEEFNPIVLASFYVSHLEVAYENEITTESWMTEPFSNELEAGQALEPWMTEPFSDELEAGQALEPWMTEPFSNELEAGQALEPWMTEPFSNELEAGQTLESWMTNSFYKELEPTVAVEDLMTTPIYSAIEESLEIEEWMTQPLI